MDKPAVGEFLATLRKEGGYTQQDVADKLNISDRTLSSWETGRTEPDLSSLAALADFYGLTVDEILRGERKSDAPDFKEETTEETPPLTERFSTFLSALKVLTAIGALCAAVVLIGFILLLYVPAPMWVDFTLVFAGAVGNAVCIALISARTNKTLLSVSDEEKGVALTIRHKAALAVIINSLAYIAWVIVILMCYYFVDYYDTNPVGTVHQYYELYTAAAVIISFIFGGALLIFGIATNLAHINCLGNERQKTAAKANVKTFKIISIFGGAIAALCLITYAVFSNVNFIETEEYFTVKGVDELYKTFQTYTLNSDRIIKEIDDDNNVHITVIPAGEYYLDFTSEKYVDATEINYYAYDFQMPIRLYDVGNNFYADFGRRFSHNNYAQEIINPSLSVYYIPTIRLYYLKDGVNIEDISLEKDLEEYFYYLNSYQVISFTSPENEPLFAVQIPYYFHRSDFGNKDWRYDYGDYNLRDELVLKRNGDEYTYYLITYRNYTPVATVALLGEVCITACVCAVVHLIKRKKIHYEF